MKLNKDCVRSIMLLCESNLGIKNNLNLKDFLNSKELKYSEDDIKYTLEKLNETSYLNMHLQCGSNEIAEVTISSLTWQGHQFLDTIRDPKVWATTKKIASKLESVSITILSNIATGVINHFIDKVMDKSSVWTKIDKFYESLS